MRCTEKNRKFCIFCAPLGPRISHKVRASIIQPGTANTYLKSQLPGLTRKLGDRRVGLKIARNHSNSRLNYSEILKTLDYRTCVEKHGRLAIDDETFQSIFVAQADQRFRRRAVKMPSRISPTDAPNLSSVTKQRSARCP